MTLGMDKKSSKNEKSSTFGRPKERDRRGEFRGVEILVKLVKFGIGQKVLGI